MTETQSLNSNSPAVIDSFNNNPLNQPSNTKGSLPDPPTFKDLFFTNG